MHVKEENSLLGFQCQCGYDSTIDYCQNPTLTFLSIQELAAENLPSELLHAKKELLKSQKKLGEVYAALDTEKNLRAEALAYIRQLQKDKFVTLQDLNSALQDLDHKTKECKKHSEAMEQMEATINELRQALSQAFFRIHVLEAELSSKKNR